MGSNFSFILETLRLHPPFTVIGRQCTRDYKVDDNLTIPKDMNVHIPVKDLQIDPKYFTDPLQYQPERFVKDQKRQPPGFIAFGIGPRNCIGKFWNLLLYS